jgi:hypothetical protein
MCLRARSLNAARTESSLTRGYLSRLFHRSQCVDSASDRRLALCTRSPYRARIACREIGVDPISRGGSSANDRHCKSARSRAHSSRRHQDGWYLGGRRLARGLPVSRQGRAGCDRIRVPTQGHLARGRRRRRLGGGDRRERHPGPGGPAPSGREGSRHPGSGRGPSDKQLGEADRPSVQRAAAQKRRGCLNVSLPTFPPPIPSPPWQPVNRNNGWRRGNASFRR